jgi:hypothetical protein
VRAQAPVRAEAAEVAARHGSRRRPTAGGRGAAARRASPRDDGALELGLKAAAGTTHDAPAGVVRPAAAAPRAPAAPRGEPTPQLRWLFDD